MLCCDQIVLLNYMGVCQHHQFLWNVILGSEVFKILGCEPMNSFYVSYGRLSSRLQMLIFSLILSSNCVASVVIVIVLHTYDICT